MAKNKLIIIPDLIWQRIEKHRGVFSANAYIVNALDRYVPPMVGDPPVVDNQIPSSRASDAAPVVEPPQLVMEDEQELARKELARERLEKMKASMAAAAENRKRLAAVQAAAQTPAVPQLPAAPQAPANGEMPQYDDPIGTIRDANGVIIVRTGMSSEWAEIVGEKVPESKSADWWED